MDKTIGFDLDALSNLSGYSGKPSLHNRVAWKPIACERAINLKGDPMQSIGIRFNEALRSRVEKLVVKLKKAPNHPLAAAGYICFGMLARAAMIRGLAELEKELK